MCTCVLQFLFPYSIHHLLCFHCELQQYSVSLTDGVSVKKQIHPFMQCLKDFFMATSYVLVCPQKRDINITTDIVSYSKQFKNTL